MTNAMMAHNIVRDILDKGLAQSTWKDNNEKAYKELLKYRRDMELQVVKYLDRYR